jgi:hypothetical protein
VNIVILGERRAILMKRMLLIASKGKYSFEHDMTVIFLFWRRIKETVNQ